jgi:hypothetical protein
MAEYDFDTLEHAPMVVMITSTTEGGLAPPSAAGFFNWLEVRRQWRSKRWCVCREGGGGVRTRVCTKVLVVRGIHHCSLYSQRCGRGHARIGL